MKNYIYVGSWLDEKGRNGGIHAFEQEEGGRLVHCGDYRTDLAAGYLCVSCDGKYLYAVNEIKRKPGEMYISGEIHAFSVNREDGSLTYLNGISSLGVCPNYLSITEDGKTLVAINYGSEDVLARTVKEKDGTYRVEHLFEESSVLTVEIQENGFLGRICDLHTFSGEASRFYEWFQSAPHPHSVQTDPGGNLVLVADRGCDELHLFRLTQGNRRLERGKVIKTDRGIGPRVCAFHPKKKVVYIVGEILPYVLVYEYDSEMLELVQKQCIATVPEKEIYGRNKKEFFDCTHPSDIRIHPDGKTLYVCNRGDDTVTCFFIGEDGLLTMLERIPSAGSWPWTCCCDRQAKYFYVGNKSAGNVEVFEIEKDGRISDMGWSIAVERPICIQTLAI